jgi:hypothetical protein
MTDLERATVETAIREINKELERLKKLLSKKA